jgi:rhamnose transport system permease protein
VKSNRFQREMATALALASVLLILLVSAPSFFQAGNLRDLMLKNTAALVAAIGMTLVIVTGHIDISIGAQFAICGVVTGLLAREGIPIGIAALAAALAGAAMGALNGVLVAWLRMPSIVVTLAAMSLLRDSLRWATEGAWVQDLPRNFQWAGLGQTLGQPAVVLAGAAVFSAFAWGLANLSAGRALFATGADPEAARLAGIPTHWVVFSAFTVMGVLSGTAAFLNAIRFNEVPGNPNNGLELQVIAAVVVGGASITGGRATLLGTLLGVTLLGILGTALTFLGVNPFWEKALQGGIILIAAASLLQRKAKHAAR